MRIEFRNDRAFHLNKSVGMSAGMSKWNRESNIVTLAGAECKPNVARTLRSLIKDEEAKIHFPDGKNVVGKDLIAAVEKWESEQTGGIVVVIGNHRMLAWILNQVVYGGKAVPQIVEVNAADGAMMSVESHAGNRYVSTLAYSETLDLVSKQIAAGKFAQETQLRKLFGDGTGQKLWAHSKLLTMGVDRTKVEQLNKEEARKVSQTLDAAAATDKLLAEKAANGTNQGKILKGEAVRKLAALAMSGDPESKDYLTQTLNAIVANNELAAVASITAHFKGAVVEEKKGKSKK
jgi:hypothetical protein